RRNSDTADIEALRNSDTEETPTLQHVLSAKWLPGERNIETEKPIIMDVRLNKKFKGEVMIDSGCSTEFMDIKFAQRQGLEIRRKPKPEPVGGIGGPPLMSHYETQV